MCDDYGDILTVGAQKLSYLSPSSMGYHVSLGDSWPLYQSFQVRTNLNEQVAATFSLASLYPYVAAPQFFRSVR